jgi:mono/diheme cytochrome c family protein
VYSTFCAGCHGADGRARSNIQREKYDKIVRMVGRGVGKQMPAFATLLTADQIDMLAEFISSGGLRDDGTTTPSTAPPDTTTTTMVTTTTVPGTTTTVPGTTTTVPGTTTTTTTTSTTTTTLPSGIDAAFLYMDNCAACHGPNGEGGIGPALAGTSLSLAEVSTVISNGAGIMPGFSGSLSSEEIEALSAFVLGL